MSKIELNREEIRRLYNFSERYNFPEGRIRIRITETGIGTAISVVALTFTKNGWEKQDDWHNITDYDSW